MYYKWYQLYSYWVAILASLYKLKIIKTNVYPSVLLSIIGTFYIIDLKIKNDIKMSNSFFIGSVVIHLLFLFLVNLTFNLNDLIANLFILICYLIFVKVTTGKNAYQVYQEIVMYDTNIPYYQNLNRQFKGKDN